MRLISPLVSNTIILILKSRMWKIEGEIHWNWDIQSRVLTPPINKSNIFIQKVDDKPLIRPKKKIKVDPSDLEYDQFEIGIWLNLRACCIVDGGRSLDCLTSWHNWHTDFSVFCSLHLLCLLYLTDCLGMGLQNILNFLYLVFSEIVV